ncbi:hypothetical protein [Rhizobium mesosinicum]|uniref:General stress protein 17M-like domain-containing protein n=1 Tax=Rhizobium mesosinicum TaxID=335017 RepID=A0ABS7H2I6_9HYPH|nr:hypothetical protein [Rhizobium mesosinicum]MBW9056131.1 hypothetical protein [Rhizobium mesosinicum]
MPNLHNENTPTFATGTATSSLTAFFDSRDNAERSVERLKDAGIPAESIRLLPGYEADGDRANVASDDRSGFWAMLAGWLFPDEDRAVYAEGLRRGGFLVSVQVDDASYETAHDILDDEGSIDMDERADHWRREGWEVPRSAAAYDISSDERNGAAEGDMTVSEDAFAPDRTATERAMASSTVSDEAAPAADEPAVSNDAQVGEETGVPKMASGPSETLEESARKMEAERRDDRADQSQSQSGGGQSQSQGFRRE